MRRRRTILAFLLGGLASARMPVLAADETVGRRSRPVIAFYGDSTIRGYQTHTGRQLAISLPDAFAQAIGGDYRVLNEGVDGSRVEHLLAGKDGRHPPWGEMMAKADVDIVITNHASKNGNPVAQYKEDMRTMLRLAQRHGKRVILMTPAPITEGGLEAYVEAMRLLAVEEGVPLIDVFAFLLRYAARNGLAVSDIVPDGYHPADTIHVLAGQFAAKAFLELEQAVQRR